jgi:Protein of unknown function (DUF1329)
MRFFKTGLACLFACWLAVVFLPVVVSAQIPHPKKYIPTLAEVEKHKKLFDDPRPYLKEFGPKQVLPKELYSKLSYDVDKMKSLWAEVVGFRAPDVVGKIAPEMKPGKYTYQDLEKNPGFKQLMWPDLYKRIKPGGPPHAGNIPEFEIIPTRQFYWGLPIGEATKKNEGKTKLDKDGYLIPETWVSGYPFPKPSGPFKAQQIMFNVEKRYLSWGLNFYIVGRTLGYTKDLKMDFDGAYDVYHTRLAGRVLMEPYGWFDKRAKDRGEFKEFILGFQSPRDIAGAAESANYLLDINKADQLMIYLPSLRRVRKLSATDSQDPIMGQDQIYDDNEGWMQKLSPTRYPYKFEVLEEREYLVVAPTEDGAEYWSSKGLEMRNVRLERRPIYVVKLTQLDKNYVYGHRIFYIDKETFVFYHNEFFDQKGRLYRSWDGNYGWFPDMGTFTWCGTYILMRDHIDLHSGVQQPYQLPAFWTRADTSLEGFMKQK